MTLLYQQKGKLFFFSQVANVDRNSSDYTGHWQQENYPKQSKQIYQLLITDLSSVLSVIAIEFVATLPKRSSFPKGFEASQRFRL